MKSRTVNDAAPDFGRTCGYCRAGYSKAVKLLRCSGCKIIFYCSPDCQRKHWKLIHKKECKVWRKEYKNKQMSDDERYEIETASNVELGRQARAYSGSIADAYEEMMIERQKNFQKDEDELLFDHPSKAAMLANAKIAKVLEAFDRDRDKKLKFEEFNDMLKELGFKDQEEANEIFLKVCDGEGLIPEEILDAGAAANRDIGKYCEKNISFGVHEIFKAIQYCAYLKSMDQDNEDEEFMDEYELEDEKEVMWKGMILLEKLYGHAMAIVCLGELHENEFCDAVLKGVPCFDRNIASTIFDFWAHYKGHHIIKISWHKIKWIEYEEDHSDLWKVYDRNKPVHYDIFYMSQQSKQGYRDTFIEIEICDTKKCDERLELLHSGMPWAFREVDQNERRNMPQRWLLGSCASYIPFYGLTIKENAILVGRVLKLHGLDPKLCHCIYVGFEIPIEYDEKHLIVDAFNDIHGADAKFRPHAPKVPSIFHPDDLGHIFD